MNRILNKIFDSEEEAIKYLIDYEIIQEDSKCSQCRSIMKINYKRNSYLCTKTRCRNQKSIFKDTIFYKSNLKLNIILHIAYLYLLKMPIKGIMTSTGCSPNTITKWCLNVRQLCTDSLELEEKKIGGEGIIVEIDETKLGKRKYHRGHRVDGVWCVCGIERTGEKRSFVIPVDNRNESTMRNIIENYVYPGSTIYTDCWKAYNNPCDDLNIPHYTVNHSKYFKDPITGVHTNTVEGFNNALKIGIRPRNRNKEGIEEHIGFFLWSRRNSNNLWYAFLNALKNN